MWANYKSTGFTIVELLTVIVVIAILAAISIGAYNAVRERATVTGLQSSATQAFRKVKSQETIDGTYPASLNAVSIADSDIATYDYRTFNYGACVSATKNGVTYHVSSDNSAPTFGGCGQVKAEFWNNTTFSGNPAVTTYFDHMTNNWGSGNPATGINSDGFTSRFTSYIIPPVSGSYTFSTLSDDVDSLVINGVTLISNFDGSAGACCTLRSYTPMNLTAGAAVPVVFQQREGAGGAYAQLYWTHPSQTTRVGIPASAFTRVAQ